MDNVECKMIFPEHSGLIVFVQSPDLHLCGKLPFIDPRVT